MQRAQEFIEADPAGDAFAKDIRRPFGFMPTVVTPQPVFHQPDGHLPREFGADGAQIAQMRADALLVVEQGALSNSCCCVCDQGGAQPARRPARDRIA